MRKSSLLLRLIALVVFTLFVEIESLVVAATADENEHINAVHSEAPASCSGNESIAIGTGRTSSSSSSSPTDSCTVAAGNGETRQNDIGAVTELEIQQEYDHLSTVLRHHFDQSRAFQRNYQYTTGSTEYTSTSTGTSTSSNEVDESLSSNPFSDSYANNNNYHVNLSPKIDSSLVRSQHHKLLLDDDTLDDKNGSLTNTSTARHKSQRQNSSLLLNVKNLTRIIRINRIENTVTVQARCTYDQLVQTLLLDQSQPRMIPLVVPEFKSITVGGAIVGGALESSSFRYGQVSDTVTSMMILLPNGTRTTITQHTHPELYHAIPGSYGSLAIVLEATIQIRPIVSNWMELQVSTYTSMEAGIQALRQYSISGSKLSSSSLPEFVDAIQYPNGDFVIISGNILTQHSPPLTNNDNHTTSSTSQIPRTIRTEDRSSPWFYESIYDIVQAQKHHDNDVPFTRVHIPIYDYLFRYERGAFWMGRPTQFTWKTVMKNPFLIGPFLMSWKHTRFLFGQYFTATILYRLLHAIDSIAVAEKFLIQDAYIPSENTTQFVQYIRQHIPISVPIWLCPVQRPLRTQPLSPSGKFDHTNRKESDDTLINVGVWGRVDDNQGIQYMYQMEQEMIQYNGRKMLYSITAASQMPYETLYEQHVDGIEYWKLRTKYESHRIFPPIHEKLQLQSREYIAQHQTRNKKRSWKYWLSRLLT